MDEKMKKDLTILLNQYSEDISRTETAIEAREIFGEENITFDGKYDIPTLKNLLQETKKKYLDLKNLLEKS